MPIARPRFATFAPAEPVRTVLETVVFALTLKVNAPGVAPVVFAAREIYRRLAYDKKFAAVKNVSALRFVGLPNL
jgi:hypothetical protein